MRTVSAILIFIVYSGKVESALICESEFCVCHHNNKSEREVFGEIVNCSYDQNLLKRNFSLPQTANTLNLSRNNLTKVEFSLIFHSDTLSELLLNDNKIREISPNALRLPNLKRLDLSENKLEVIQEGTFDHINKLEYLNLANNKFSTFEKITFHHLKDLKEIVLDNNDLGASLEGNNLFDRSGYGLTHRIQSLSISGINLKTVHENFFVDAFDLRTLIISNNSLTETFEFPFTLEYLDISDNLISEISEEDFDLVALKVLKLNNLLIKDIPDYAFASLHSLTHLELENIKSLVNFSVTAFGKEVLEDADDFTLETLSLQGSRLTTLDEQLEVPFGQLMKLNLQGNFWNCDCKLKWIKKLQIPPEDYDHLRCYTPKHLYNSRIFELDEKFFTCPKKTTRSHNVIVTILVISFCLLLTSLAIWVYMFMPRSQTRCDLSNMYSGAGYSVLPVHVSTVRDPL